MMLLSLRMNYHRPTLMSPFQNSPTTLCRGGRDHPLWMSYRRSMKKIQWMPLWHLSQLTSICTRCSSFRSSMQVWGTKCKASMRLSLSGSKTDSSTPVTERSMSMISHARGANFRSEHTPKRCNTSHCKYLFFFQILPFWLVHHLL